MPAVLLLSDVHPAFGSIRVDNTAAMLRTPVASDNAFQWHQLCLLRLAVWQSLQIPASSFGQVHMAGVAATEGSSDSEPAGSKSSYPCEERSTDFLVVVGKHI